MARYYSIRIGPTLYLSQDGGSSSLARARVIGWENMITPVTGNSVRANTGKAIRQTILRPAGDQLEIQIETWLTKTIWQAVLAIIDNCNANDVNTTITAVGDTGNFTKNVKPVLQQPYSAERFLNEKILRPVFRFETV